MPPIVVALLLLLALGSASTVTARQLTFEWKDNSDNEAGFRIERSGDGASFQEIATVAMNMARYVDDGLPAATTYWYRARAYNANGVSAYTTPVSGTTAAAALNSAPKLSAIAHRTISQNASTGPIAFTVSDAETSAANLKVSAFSANTTVVPNGNIVFGGAGANRTVTVTPAANQSGTASITVKVDDGARSTTYTFVLTVKPANQAPTIGRISNRSVVPGASTGPIPFDIGDADTPAAGLVLIGNSSNSDLVPVANITFGGTGGKRTVRVQTMANRTGWATIWVKVSDGELTAYTSFLVTVSKAVAATAGSSDANTTAGLANLSTRARSGSVDDPLIAGFVISGEGSKRLLLRAVGPTLGQPPFDVPDVLRDPCLVLKRWNNGAYEDLAASLDWGDASVADLTALAEASARAFAFGLVDGSRDAAVLLDLPAGQYTMVAAGEDGGAGIALVELYDVDDASTGANIVNLSTRARVGAGGDVLIAGFVIPGNDARTILLRAVGPALGLPPFGLQDVLADPVMEVHRREGDGTDVLVLSNDNWGDDPTATESLEIATQLVSAFALPPGGRDAAAVLSLPPGVYTVVVRGAGGGTGTALVESYVLP